MVKKSLILKAPVPFLFLLFELIFSKTCKVAWGTRAGGHVRSYDLSQFLRERDDIFAIHRQTVVMATATGTQEANVNLHMQN